MSPVGRHLAAMILLTTTPLVQAQTAEMPTPESFAVGDRWEWRQVDSRTKQEEGRRTRVVVLVEGVLKFSDGGRTSQLSQAFIGAPSPQPWRVWPLQVGKKWKYEEQWTRKDGGSGSTRQNVEVVAYEEVSVPAGKFMAYKIEYRGWYQRNQRGHGGRQDDTYWYAPEVKADVKHVREDKENMYTRELTSYQLGSR